MCKDKNKKEYTGSVICVFNDNKNLKSSYIPP